MGLKGEGDRTVGVRVVVVAGVVALRLWVDTEAAGLRAATFALLLIFALGRAPGVGEGFVGRVLIGDGGRERS